MHQNQEMTDFNYKNYSLEQLENWVHDAMTSGEATPEEIYNVIRRAVEENYYIYKDKVSKAYELLSLLNGNGKGHIEALDKEAYDAVMREKEYYEPSMPPWGHSDLEYMVHHSKDKVVKWKLPIEMDGLTGECFVNFPDDLLEAANLKEGDRVEWIDNNDGSYIIRKSK